MTLAAIAPLVSIAAAVLAVGVVVGHQAATRRSQKKVSDARKRLAAALEELQRRFESDQSESLGMPATESRLLELIGLASAAENEGNIDKALRYYQEILDNSTNAEDPIAIRYASIAASKIVHLSEAISGSTATANRLTRAAKAIQELNEVA